MSSSFIFLFLSVSSSLSSVETLVRRATRLDLFVLIASVWKESDEE